MGRRAIYRFKLNPRQIEVMQMLADGMTTKEIAIKLHLSERTIQCHRYMALSYADCRSMPHLIAYCFRNGLIK